MNQELNARAVELLSKVELNADLTGKTTEETTLYRQLSERLGPAVAALLKRYEKRRVVLELDESIEPEPTGSYIGGHPFISADENFKWPRSEDGEELMTFIMQLNFADLPKLEGFPVSGLIQFWIRGEDDLFGLSFDEGDTGRGGLLVKFYPGDQIKTPASSPSDPIPNKLDEYDGLGPLAVTEPFALIGSEALSFFSREDDLIDEAVTGLFDWEVRELVEDLHPDFAFEPKSQVGGYPGFIQGDPRYRNPGPQTLIFQVESMATASGSDVILWGDSGNAQVFGDLEDLKRGDVSSFWWDWACF